MKKLILTIALLATHNASADGFVCQDQTGDLKVAVYNQTQPSLGTRNAAQMILSNPNYAHGNKTIATFSAESGLLDNKASDYAANVDLRFTNSSRKGELIGGTKLGYLDQIELSVAHNYAQPLAEGTEVLGVLTLLKRDGVTATVLMACSRYLKGE